MARFHGFIGYGHTQDGAPGVKELVITEREAFGEIKQDTRQLREGEYLHDDISLQNIVSVVADAFANENYLAIKYVKQAGRYWTVDSVTVEPPRLLLRLGGVWNGVKAPVADGP